MQKFDTVDSILSHTEALIPAGGKFINNRYELPSPIMFELTNPMARFYCAKENRDKVAISAAETLYAFSGMNGSDFIWEFRDWEDPRIKKMKDNSGIGDSLRFFDRKELGLLDYSFSNSLRQKSEKHFFDQLESAIHTIKYDKEHTNVVLQFISYNNSKSIFQAWLYCRSNKLNMMVYAGYLDNNELIFKYVPTFSFLLQIISELTSLEMGSVQFNIGCLYSDKNLKGSIPPIIKLNDFRYPLGSLTLRDLDVLMSIMVEFVSRLDENSLGRANPFEGDERVKMWSDYAEIFRAWKAEKAGYKIQMEQNFYHPQLRFIYKGEAL